MSRRLLQAIEEELDAGAFGYHEALTAAVCVQSRWGCAATELPVQRVGFFTLAGWGAFNFKSPDHDAASAWRVAAQERS